MFSERGYANARVVDIAKAAGTSPAAILYWFDGKDGLLAMKARGVTQQRVERTWLGEAGRLLGPGFDSSSLRRSR